MFEQKNVEMKSLSPTHGQGYGGGNVYSPTSITHNYTNPGETGHISYMDIVKKVEPCCVNTLKVVGGLLLSYMMIHTAIQAELGPVNEDIGEIHDKLNIILDSNITGELDKFISMPITDRRGNSTTHPVCALALLLAINACPNSYRTTCLRSNTIALSTGLSIMGPLSAVNWPTGTARTACEAMRARAWDACGESVVCGCGWNIGGDFALANGGTLCTSL